ncbi:MAG: hypothetical protein WC469_02630 [Candidatus Omnitrophota bacterium]
MNRNALYLAIFGILCVLAGVLVGAGITRRAWPVPERPPFRHRAERFMGYRPWGKPADKRGGESFVEFLAVKLDLSSEQKAKVADILESARLKIDEIGRNVRSSILGIKDDSDRQIIAVLNSQQQEKFKALLKEFEKRGGPKRKQGGHGPMSGHVPLPGEELPSPEG